MTHPYEKMKKLKEHYDMLGYICAAQYGIPTRCPCGGEIKIDVSPIRMSRYFTCKKYEDDGMHFRPPWAFGVEEELQKLRTEVNNMAEEIAKLKMLITSTSRP
ncbi:unnamed protein product [Eruca vesicaria subsp. sativa]|uniref:Uncharacterized protein n=1 Tax=Eruca vesicaria subsp. sativa TaxID=29727 RepID=A0ABC8JBT3_ERUVS|nr:unnamed protein product [Eruca vesicaria subsp. sativa]